MKYNEALDGNENEPNVTLCKIMDEFQKQY
jgi:hypothetical protein